MCLNISKEYIKNVGGIDVNAIDAFSGVKIESERKKDMAEDDMTFQSDIYFL